MMYAILIYGESGVFEQLPKAAQDKVMAGHSGLQQALGARGDYLSVKLMPPSSAVTLEPAVDDTTPPLVLDGPFAETKESFLGFYAAEFESLEDALAHARRISSPIARIEVRPIHWAGGVLSTEREDVGMA
ncbi:YciI family protein [Ovoidimarina sediminis]|uniref:YciI family protein n=1 Tax=Ovoidimarina sediminis TaxID=3079856 RepID=UPI0029137694|nr:YciI family protein [Rhodophyticola sp. MJ-SS7]MDU8946630.1 YciI family protein [Rhodophyticola sp. MJ-SS7]